MLSYQSGNEECHLPQEERAAKARDLVDFSGMPLSLCTKALELNGDDTSRAAEWVFSDEAFAFMDDGGGEGASASGTSGGGGGSADGEPGADPKVVERWANAKTLEEVTMRPLKLCFCALEMHNDSMELAVDWLSKPEGGGAYSKLMMTEEKAEVRVEADELGIEGVALGVASGFVTDAQLTASSSFDPELVAATATSETTPVATPAAVAATTTTEAAETTPVAVAASMTTEAAETTATSPVAVAATTSTETTAAEGMASLCAPRPRCPSASRASFGRLTRVILPTLLIESILFS